MRYSGPDGHTGRGIVMTIGTIVVIVAVALIVMYLVFFL